MRWFCHSCNNVTPPVPFSSIVEEATRVKKHAKPTPSKAALESVWQVAPSSRQQALGSSLAEFADGFGDTSKPCFGCFGSLYGEYDPLLVTVGQPVEEALGVRIAVKRF